MDVLVQSFITESAAFLASSRIAFNDGPDTDVQRIDDGSAPRYGVFVNGDPGEVEAARDILAMFPASAAAIVADPAIRAAD